MLTDRRTNGQTRVNGGFPLRKKCAKKTRRRWDGKKSPLVSSKHGLSTRSRSSPPHSGRKMSRERKRSDFCLANEKNSRLPGSTSSPETNKSNQAYLFVPIHFSCAMKPPLFLRQTLASEQRYSDKLFRGFSGRLFSSIWPVPSPSTWSASYRSCSWNWEVCNGPLEASRNSLNRCYAILFADDSVLWNSVEQHPGRWQTVERM